MRRIAFLCPLLALSGCGYATWWNPPLTGGYNPNRPRAASENMQRVMGREPAVGPIATEAGDIWPGPLRAAPTLQDLEANGAASAAQAPVPGSPLGRAAPGPVIGSSTPPGSNQPGLAPATVAPPLSSYKAPPAAPPGRTQGGQVVQTPGGAVVTNGGSAGYRTGTTTGGGQVIVVPNGNGTSTVIHPDGKIETVPTPK